MKKNIYLLLFAVMSFAGKSIGQTVIPCGNPEMQKYYLQQHPEIADYEKKLEKDIAYYIANHGKSAPGSISRKTADEHKWDDVYDLPVVVHVIHDNGIELLPDNKIYNLIAEMNRFYNQENNVTSVIAPFKPYIGKANFRFHLATKDPNGNPTKGITHRLSYLTRGGDDQAKFDQWNPANYINIWFISVIGNKPKVGIIVAYATPPSSAAAQPYKDGIISNYSFIDDATTGSGTGGSIDHEMGHILNLAHTFGPTNDPHTNKSGTCTDDDNVDDTPPTEGNLGGCSLWDTVCSGNYYKLYITSKGADSLVNYPDTSNEQNIMNYADCKIMFTKGQVERMRGALNSDIGNRDSLWQPYNLALTGALAPIPDLKPINDFSVKNNTLKEAAYFTCPGNPLKFVSQSWQDTVIQVDWAFTNNAASPTASAVQGTAGAVVNVASTVTNSFDLPGWVTVTMTSTGNNSGATTTEFPRTVFVADNNATQADGYFMDFNNADTAKWPMFNYYSNEFKWKIADVGMYDNSSIEFTGFDARGLFSVTGSAYGDYDDFFSMPFDLSSFANTACNLNYFYSGAARTSNTGDMNDRMEISYSTDHAASWKILGDTLMKSKIVNRGAVSTAYTPTSLADWAPMSISLPAAARTPYTVFRFRYKPGLSISLADGTINPRAGSFATSNNFYMDRIHFSQWPAAVSNAKLGDMDVTVVPNPTNGDAYVRISDAGNGTANVIVSDITGKQVYAASQQIAGNQANIVIPKSAIEVKGVYMVQTITGNQTRTQKLVVY